MGFLILDTDKWSTDSLKRQLSALADRPVQVATDWSKLGLISRKKTPPPDVIILDQDGDPECVDGFCQEFARLPESSAVIVIGSSRESRALTRHDLYVRKPVYGKRLEHALAKSYSALQLKRSAVGFIGQSVPRGLVRELGGNPDHWRELIKVNGEGSDPHSWAKLGVVFVMPGELNPSDLEVVSRMYKFTSAARITIVGVGTAPEETHSLRTRANYFVDSEGDWKEFLEKLAMTRMQKFYSELLLSRAKKFLDESRGMEGRYTLRKIIRQDPWNLAARSHLAEAYFSAGKFHKAGELYRQSLALNPCQPRPYLRLLEIECKQSGKVCESTLAKAKLYCPGIVELQGIS